jgi:hypothetical protein
MVAEGVFDPTQAPALISMGVRSVRSGKGVRIRYPSRFGTKEVEHGHVALLAKTTVNLHLALPGIIALIVGVLILIFPKLLNYLVAGYLIFVGVIQVFNIHI